jgi:opacity protein-like surface antigen
MKKIGLAALTAVLMSGSAYAADVYQQGGGLKDEPYQEGVRRGWSGFVITGTLGYADRDIEGSRSINGEAGLYRVDKNGPDRCDGFTCFDSATGKFVPQAGFGGVGYDPAADNTTDAVRYELPLIESLFSGDGGDFSSQGFQGGVEVGYRHQMGRWVPELALGLSIDADSQKSKSFLTEHAATLDATALGGPVVAGVLTGEGFQSIEKEGDVYGTLRLGHTLNDRLLIGVGGGIVAGRFNIKGGHDFDIDTSGILATSFNETETAYGYVLEAYAKYKLSKNVDFGILGQYKDFGDVSAGGNAKGFDQANVLGPIGAYARVNDKASFDVDEWTIKGTLTYTIGD